MWLINAYKLIHENQFRLESFPDERNLSYAILSHRWEEEEVLFEHVMRKCSLNDVRRMRGFFKVKMCCRQALKLSLTYVWVDTCCIDKSSSAELQEAINSMFRWYSSAQVCFAYLSDVDKWESSLKDSKWFDRGWTLQELVAPVDVTFYDHTWSQLGHRTTLASHISEITGIRREILTRGFKNCKKPLIAEIMSWARGRQTTRVEDRAYSLMGLFDVNMAMLYGEGKNAFRRLQEEIIRNSEDQSILFCEAIGVPTFIHSRNGGYFDRERYLAESPDAFPVRGFYANRDIVPASRSAPHTITNQGISLEMELVPWTGYIFLGLLNYHEDVFDDMRMELSREKVVHAIKLRKVSGGQVYVRIEHEGSMVWIGNITRRSLRRKHISIAKAPNENEYSKICLAPPLYGFKWNVFQASSSRNEAFATVDSRYGTFDVESGHHLCTPGNFGTVAELEIKTSESSALTLGIGFLEDFTPYFYVHDRGDSPHAFANSRTFAELTKNHSRSDWCKDTQLLQDKELQVVSLSSTMGGYRYNENGSSRTLLVYADPHRCNEQADELTVLTVGIMSEEDQENFLWIEIVKPIGWGLVGGWTVLVDCLSTECSSRAMECREKLIDSIVRDWEMKANVTAYQSAFEKRLQETFEDRDKYWHGLIRNPWRFCSKASANRVGRKKRGTV